MYISLFLRLSLRIVYRIFIVKLFFLLLLRFVILLWLLHCHLSWYGGFQDLGWSICLGYLTILNGNFRSTKRRILGRLEK